MINAAFPLAPYLFFPQTWASLHRTAPATAAPPPPGLYTTSQFQQTPNEKAENHWTNPKGGLIVISYSIRLKIKQT